LFQNVASPALVDSGPVKTQNDEYLVEQLIRQIQAGHESAAFQLREFMARGVRWYLRRNAREPNIETTTQQILDALIQAVKDYGVTNLASLTSFTRASVRAFAVNPAVTRTRTDPVDQVRVESIKQALYDLTPRERDALVRYFEGQPPGRICASLGMTEEALAALRHRLRKRCEELARG